MEQSTRIDVITTSVKTGEKKHIRYDNQTLLLEVQEIPLNVLLYNPYNGRIRSMVKSFETAQNRAVDNESSKDVLIIEQFLWESAKGKNEKTLESLREIGQQEIGIVTKDGVIIDGNRRACLLNILNRENSNFNFFKAIVLPETLKENEREITYLETRYQMGVDSKVDYNPVEKYIRCFELMHLHQFSTSEIADLMAESVARINEWLQIFDLMEDYLNYLNTPNLYTRLEKREGHFVDLYNYLNHYRKDKRSTNWLPTNEDVKALKEIYFDYIRLGIPVQRARVLGKPAGGNSFFSKKEVWDDFAKVHNDIKTDYVELNFDKLKSQFPEQSNEDTILIIDTQWKEKNEPLLIENLSFNEIILKEINETFVPLRLLKRIKANVEKINVDAIEVTTKGEVVVTIEYIQNKLTEINNRIIND